MEMTEGSSNIQYNDNENWALQCADLSVWNLNFHFHSDCSLHDCRRNKIILYLIYLLLLIICCSEWFAIFMKL